MIQPALFGGLFIGVLSALPFVNLANCCCLWFIGGGVLAAYLDQQNESRPSVGLGRGALVGLLAGVFGAFVWLIVGSALRAAIAPFQEQLFETVLRNAQDMPPETRAWLEMMMERGDAPFQRALAFMVQLLAGMIFGTLGGVIGAAYFRRDVPPAIGGPGVPPPLP